MKKVFIIIIIHCSLYIVNCFGQSITWQRTYNRTMWFPDYGYDLCQSTDGNFYLAGRSYPGYIYILKINQYGDTIWTRAEIGGVATAVTASNDGGCVITGLMSHSKSFTIKYSVNGDVIWNKEYSGTNMYNEDIATTIDGYVICGYDWATYFDGYYAKVDLQGNLLWERYYPSDFIRIFRSVISNNDGSLIFTGVLDTTGSPSLAVVMKTESNGNVQWEKRYSINGNGAGGKTIQKISQGYLIGGRTLDSTNTIRSEFILRLNSEGNLINQNVFSSYQDEEFQHISVANENRYVMSIYREGSGFIVHGKILIIDSLGNIIRQKILNDSNQIVLNSSLCLPNGDMIFTGMSEFDNITTEDIYAARTDSNLNVPPPISIKVSSEEVTKEFKLLQNYPNPFNPVTEIRYELPKSTFVSIKIYNALGELVKTLLNNEYKTEGIYTAKFDGTNFASGIYFYSLWVSTPSGETKDFKTTKKMVLIK